MVKIFDFYLLKIVLAAITFSILLSFCLNGLIALLNIPAMIFYNVSTYLILHYFWEILITNFLVSITNIVPTSLFLGLLYLKYNQTFNFLQNNNINTRRFIYTRFIGIAVLLSSLIFIINEQWLWRFSPKRMILWQDALDKGAQPKDTILRLGSQKFIYMSDILKIKNGFKAKQVYIFDFSISCIKVAPIAYYENNTRLWHIPMFTEHNFISANTTTRGKNLNYSIPGEFLKLILQHRSITECNIMETLQLRKAYHQFNLDVTPLNLNIYKMVGDTILGFLLSCLGIWLFFLFERKKNILNRVGVIMVIAMPLSIQAIVKILNIV